MRQHASRSGHLCQDTWTAGRMGAQERQNCQLGLQKAKQSILHGLHDTLATEWQQACGSKAAKRLKPEQGPSLVKAVQRQHCSEGARRKFYDCRTGWPCTEQLRGNVAEPSNRSTKGKRWCRIIATTEQRYACACKKLQGKVARQAN